jgi:HAD superfamily hydrolase (TIGR01549 family)
LGFLIRAITFDFWNTLFVGVNAGDLRLRKIQDILGQAGHADIADPVIDRATTHAWREWDRVWLEDCRTFGAEEWVSLVLADLGVSLNQPERDVLVHAMATSGMQANPPLVDGLVDLLPRLAQRFRLGVICDTGLSPGWILREWMQTHGILRHFTHLTFSDELGVSKPHPSAFLTTLDQLDVAPDQAAHVGDYPRTDIAGAKGVGMRAIRFTGVYDWGNGVVPADGEIASYAQLESLLRSWDA